jgi:Integrase zinc binding domain
MTVLHFGREKTIELVQRQFTWKDIRREVAEYVRSCPVCQSKAVHRHHPYGELQSLPIPTEPFKDITLDWITGLPEAINRTGERCNAILTIVDRLTRYALFIPCCDTMGAAEFAGTLFSGLEYRHGTPTSILSDTTENQAGTQGSLVVGQRCMAT